MTFNVEPIFFGEFYYSKYCIATTVSWYGFAPAALFEEDDYLNIGRDIPLTIDMKTSQTIASIFIMQNEFTRLRDGSNLSAYVAVGESADYR